MRTTTILSGTFCLVLILTVLSACAAFEDPSQRATENAQNTALWTLVYDFQTQKPTMEAMALTADAAVQLSTQLSNVSIQNQNLQRTNDALVALARGGQGLQPTAIGGGQPAGVVPTSGVPSGSIPTTVAGQPGQGLPTPTFNVSGSNTISTNVTGNTSSGAGFSRAAMSLSRTDDGCAQDIQNSFVQTIDSINFTTEVRNITPGIGFSLNIKFQDPVSGERIVASDPDFWISDDNYDQTCVWYNIDRSTMVFNVGTYIAEFLADGEVGAQTTFTIVADTEGSTDTTQ